MVYNLFRDIRRQRKSSSYDCYILSDVMIRPPILVFIFLASVTIIAVGFYSALTGAAG